MKRYSLKISKCGTIEHQLKPRGKWCKYEDIENDGVIKKYLNRDYQQRKRIRELEKELSELKSLISECDLSFITPYTE